MSEFPEYLRLDSSLDEHLPMSIVAFGPNTLALGGRCFDEVVLHTFFTDETVTRCVGTVRAAAEQAGRDPSAVRVWSCLATVGDHVPYEARLMKTMGRLATYLQIYGDLLVRTNRWDPAALQHFRDSPTVAGRRGAFDAGASVEELERLAEVIPTEWLAPSATGAPSSARRRYSTSSTWAATGSSCTAPPRPVVAAYHAARK